MRSDYGCYRNRKFSDIFPDSATFVSEYKESGLYAENNRISDTSATHLFYLLYAEYGNSVVASSDENQFKYQLLATIFEYGPSWEKKLGIQSTLRSLTEEQLLTGAKSISNHALNPNTEPTVEELGYVSEQQVIKQKKDRLGAYSVLYDLINNDVTKEFISKFKRFFLQIVIPERPLWYVEENEEEDN